MEEGRKISQLLQERSCAKGCVICSSCCVCLSVWCFFCFLVFYALMLSRFPVLPSASVCLSRSCLFLLLCFPAFVLLCLAAPRLFCLSFSTLTLPVSSCSAFVLSALLVFLSLHKASSWASKFLCRIRLQSVVCSNLPRGPCNQCLRSCCP